MLTIQRWEFSFTALLCKVWQSQTSQRCCIAVAFTHGGHRKRSDVAGPMLKINGLQEFAGQFAYMVLFRAAKPKR